MSFCDERSSSSPRGGGATSLDVKTKKEINKHFIPDFFPHNKLSLSKKCRKVSSHKLLTC